MKSYILLFTTFTATSLAQDASLIDDAFECSMVAAFAAYSAPTKQVRESWRTSAQNWLDEAYIRGGTDSDYEVVPEHIMSEFEGLDRQSVYSLSTETYANKDCERLDG